VLQDSSGELVTILDDEERPCGSATRAEVRRQNLLHAVTAILVRRADGRVYVHRRTETKDVYPGAYDCWAGGVLLADEDPLAGARRELAEELGVAGVALEPLLVTRYDDAFVRCVQHAYSAIWDGPIVHQEAEVAWGAWWSLDTLATRLADPGFEFVPDGRRLVAECGLLAPSVLSRDA
jgi:8-oxo-dGTP pyrophosphatase MutT (NUDIX family)